MPIWIGLILAPVLALTDLTVSYATVGWACAHQATYAVHGVHALFLLATAACAVESYRGWRAGALVVPASERRVSLPVLAGLSTLIAMFSTAAVIAMWVPTWLIATCLA